MSIEDGRLLARVRRALVRAAVAVERAGSEEARRAPMIRQIRCLTAIALLRGRELQQGSRLRAERVAHGLSSQEAAIVSLAMLSDAYKHREAVEQLLPVLDREGIHRLLATAPGPEAMRWPLVAIARRLVAMDDVAEAARWLMGEDDQPKARVHRIAAELDRFPEPARAALLEAAWEAAGRVPRPVKAADLNALVSMLAELAPRLDPARSRAALDRAAAELAAWPEDKLFWDSYEGEEDPRTVLARARSAEATEANVAPLEENAAKEAEDLAEQVERTIAELCGASGGDRYGPAYRLYQDELDALGKAARHLSAPAVASTLHAVWDDLRSTPHYPVTWWHLAGCAVDLALHAPEEDRARFAAELLAESDAHPERTPALHELRGWERLYDEPERKAYLKRRLARRSLPEARRWVEAVGQLAEGATAEDRPRFLDHQVRLVRLAPESERLELLAAIASAARGEPWRALAAEIAELARPALVAGNSGAVWALSRILDAAPSADERARIARLALAASPKALNGNGAVGPLLEALPESEADAEIARMKAIRGFRIASLPRRLWPPATPASPPGKGVVGELPPALDRARSIADLPAMFAQWPDARSYGWVIDLLVARGWAADYAEQVRGFEDPSQRLEAWSKLWPHLGEPARAALEGDVEIAARAEQGGKLLRRLVFIERVSVSTALRLWAVDGGPDADLHHQAWGSRPWPGHLAPYLRALAGPAAAGAAADAVMAVLSWCKDPPSA